MANARPRYTGKPYPGEKIEEFSDHLKKNLRRFYPNSEAVEDDVWGHPADQFVTEILTSTDWVVSELYHMKSDLTSKEIELEHGDILKSLIASEKKLLTISPDLDRLISIDANPRGCAEAIREMINHLNIASHLVEKTTKSKGTEQKKNPLAKEMIIRVTEVLRNNNINPTAWVKENDKSKTSDTINILKMIGDEIGLNYDVRTWQRFIREVKEEAAKEEVHNCPSKKGPN